MAAISMITAAAALAPVGDVFVKMLGAGHGILFICFGRYLVGGLIGAAALISTGRFRPPRASGLLAHAGRAGLMAASIAALVAALGAAPLADALAGFYLAPVFATALSAAMLGERLSPLRVGGLGLSLSGALAILDPQGAPGVGGLIAVGSGLLFAFYLISARTAPAEEDPASAATVQSLIAAALLAPFALSGDAAAPAAGEIWLFIGIGAISVACQGVTLAAHRWADAATLAPFFYAALISSLVIGYLMLGEIPGQASLFGVLAIAAGGALAAAAPDRARAEVAAAR